MAVNTTNLEDAYTVFSSVSLAGSGSTLKATDVITSTLSVAGALTLSGTSITANAVLVGSGAAKGPTLAFSSEASLGLFRSAASTIQPSYGTFDLAGANIAFSSGTTAQSASTTKVAQGQMIFSVLSLTTNGAAIYFRSGNSTYVWPSSGVIG